MKIRAPCRGARTECIQMERQEEVLRLGVRKSWYLPSNHKLQFDPSSNRQLETTKKRDITDSSRCKSKDLPPSLKHIAVKLGLRTVDPVSQRQVFASNNLQDMYLTAQPQSSISARAINSSVKIKEIPGGANDCSSDQKLPGNKTIDSSSCIGYTECVVPWNFGCMADEQRWVSACSR